MRGWGRGVARGALVAVVLLMAMPVAAAELSLERDALDIEFDQPMRVLDNAPIAITTVPARNWACEWSDDTTVFCATREPLPLATNVRVEVPALPRADGTMERAQVLRAETDRPALYSSSGLVWVDGAPVITLTSDHQIRPEQARQHLRIEADGRIWPVAGLEDARIAGDDSPTRMRVQLPAGLPADTVLQLVTAPGLRSEDGPLPSTKDDEVERFHYREPFRVRAVRCDYEGGTSEVLAGDLARTLRCNADGRIRVLLSGTLDDASLEALRAGLPDGVRWVSREVAAHDWDGLRDGNRVERARGDELVLAAALPHGSRIAIPFDVRLRDTRGRASEAWSMTVELGPPQPSVQPASGSRLIADVERAGELEVTNAPEVNVAMLGIAAEPMIANTTVPATRGTRATLSTPQTRRVLAEGGTVLWSVGRTGARIELAAPGFDLAVVTMDGSTVLAWAHDWQTGRPLPDARIELGVAGSDGQWKPVAEALTDRDGVARIVIAADARPSREVRGGPSYAWVVRGTHGNRRAVRAVAQRTSWWRERRDDEDTLRLFVVTDRPLYRAGDMLRLHGWVRDTPGGRLEARAVDPFRLALVGSREGTEVVDAFVEPGAGGSFSAELRLPEHMLDDEYCFAIPEWALESEVCVFVGTYRAQDLWGEARLSPGVVRNGESLALQLEAGYLSGGPASSVGVLDVSAAMRHASPAEAFPAYAAFAFGVDEADIDPAHDGRWLQASTPPIRGVRLDEEGRATLRWPLSATGGGGRNAGGFVFARLEVSATLGAVGGEAIALNAPPVWVSAADAFVGLAITPAWPTHDGPVRATAVVIDAQGRPLPDGAITLTVTRENARGTSDVVATCTLAHGLEATCPVPRTSSGLYRFTASRKGALDAVFERYVYVPGSGEVRSRHAASLRLATPLATHDAPMRLRLDHPYAEADALVIITSGDALLHVQRVRVDDGAQALVLPTHAGGRAGIRVQVLVRERSPRGARANGTREAPRYVDASIDVAVPLPPPEAAIELRFDAAASRPGDAVRLVVRNRGKAPRTITLAVFDDALRQLAGARWDAFDPRGAGWRGQAPTTRFGNSVWHFGGFAFYRPLTLPWPDGARGVQPGRWQPSNDLEAVGDVLFNLTSADGGALETEELDRLTVTGSRLATLPVPATQALVRDAAELARLPTTDRGPAVDRSAFGARVRNAFLQTVLWEPSVTLQPGEERVFTLTLPDNLTRWYAAAWSVSGDDDFTLDTAQIEVGLPVEVRLLAPTRLYPGDRARLIGNVRHTGDAAATAETALWTEGVHAEAAAPVSLTAGGQAPFTLQVAPTDADQARTGSLRAVAAARVNGVADAVSRGITLASPRIRASRVQAGWVGRTPLRLDMPALPRSTEDALLQVTLLPGADALVHDWIDDLHRYPHRCWEQILSRAVAGAVAIERGEGDRFPDAKAAIDEALRNIPVFQDRSGSFRYFADEDDSDNGDPVLTAYSVRALRLLAALGHDVPLKPISQADGYLNRIHGDLDDTADDRVRLAYVAAGQERPRRDLTDALWGVFDTLPLPGQVAAVSAMADGKHPEAKAAVARVMKRAPLRGEARVLKTDARFDRWMGSDLREQCALLDVLYRHPSLASEADRRALAMGLGNLYAGGMDDVDTQTGATCLMALRALPKAEGSGVTLDVAHGDSRATLALAEGAPRTFTTPATPGAAVQLRGQVPGEAPASYLVEVRYSEDAREATSTAIGFALERRHAVLRDGAWVPVQGQQVREGDWVRITLVVRTGAERHFVALTDDVPGGLQPTDLALSGVAGLDLKAVSSEGSGWFATRRLDPVAPKFYARYLPAGTHEVHYFARVGNAGDYLAAPAQAELMYGAATRARTGAQRLEFLPQE